MQTGDGHDVIDSRLAEVGSDRIAQQCLVAGEDGGHKPRRIAGVQLQNLFLHGVSQPGGPPPGRGRAQVAVDRLSPTVSQQKNAPGYERGHLVVLNSCRAFQVDVILHRTPRGQLQQSRIPVVDGPHAPQAGKLRAHGDLCAVIRRRRIVQQNHGHAHRIGFRQRLRRGLDKKSERPAVPQRHGQRCADQNRPIPRRFL
ncbi:hypothetical protein SDC9_142367 [bioreactor metagenome]|uniref:Uncharacterized protein n=1 Tax=bioreactor metagenome TaxID=1076179 RepID=A0A645E0A1_9ZZZZ